MPAGATDPEFIREVWALYGIGVTIILLRFFTRMKTVGFRGFQGDDFFSILVLIFWTMDAATVHIIYYVGTNVEASSITRPLTAKEIADYTYGSKLQITAWYSYTALIWCMKGCMLCFFKRLTFGLWQNRLVNWLSWVCGVTYVAVFLTITFGCFPFSHNYQVRPDPGSKCTLKLQNFLVSVVFNVVTDAAILCIPLPLLWKLKVPIQRKLVIGVMLSSGLFVICAAIIRVALTLGSHPSALNINRWGVRETIVGILTVNIPILRPMTTKGFWTGSFVPSTSNSRGATTGGPLSTVPGHKYEMTPSVKGSEHPISDGGSEEFIIGGKGVKVQTSYEVTSDIEKGDWSNGSHEYGIGGTSKVMVNGRAN